MDAEGEANSTEHKTKDEEVMEGGDSIHWGSHLRFAKDGVIANIVEVGTEGIPRYFKAMYCSPFNPSLSNKNGAIQVEWYCYFLYSLLCCLVAHLFFLYFIHISALELVTSMAK